MGLPPRYKSIDAWRGIACLMIVVLHSWPHDYFGREALRAGVPMFFVISGYCIAATAQSTIRKGESTGRYFLRRFRRIYPPWWVFLALVSWFILTPLGSVVVDDRGIHSPRELSPFAWVGNVSLTETWLATVLGRDPIFVNGHAWTLCYEEQFYAVVGVLLFLCPHRFFTGCLAVTGLVLASFWGLPRLGLSVRGSFLDLSWLAFAAGVWVYHQRVLAPSNRWLWLLPIAGILLALRKPASPDWFLLPAFGFAILLAILSPWDEKIAGSVGPLNWFGLMCYSLYLTHLPVTHWVFLQLERFGPLTSVSCAVVASVLVGAMFHLTVERRFLNRS